MSLNALHRSGQPKLTTHRTARAISSFPSVNNNIFFISRKITTIISLTYGLQFTKYLCFSEIKRHLSFVMHQSFVTTAPPPTEEGGDYDFSASVPCYETTPRGQPGGQNFAFCPALHNRKSPWGKESNLSQILSFPQHWEDTRKVIALHFSLAIPLFRPKAQVYKSYNWT